VDAVGNSGAALKIGVYGALTYDVIAAACSSPQTTEINAGARAETLMKWVYIGIGQAALFTAIGTAAEVADGNSPWPPLIGFGLAASLMWVSYAHAKQSGLESDEPGTESYG
jgi:hypothetical protein